MLLHEKRDERLFMNYDGPFVIQLISTFAKYLLENTLITESISKKFYRVFIELAQNVALYSTDRLELKNGVSVGRGKVYILENSVDFKCVTVNRVKKEQTDLLIKNCLEINSTPFDILRSKKRNLYKLANYKDTGAHIGLIMIRIYSENILNSEIIENSDGETYFKITATLNRNNKSSSEKI